MKCILGKDVVGRAREELGTLVGNFLEEAAAELQEGRRLAYAFYCRLRELTSKVELQFFCPLYLDHCRRL